MPAHVHVVMTMSGVGMCQGVLLFTASVKLTSLGALPYCITHSRLLCRTMISKSCHLAPLTLTSRGHRTSHIVLAPAASRAAASAPGILRYNLPPIPGPAPARARGQKEGRRRRAAYNRARGHAGYNFPTLVMRCVCRSASLPKRSPEVPIPR